MVNTCCELGFKTRALKGGPRHILNYYYGIIEVSNFFYLINKKKKTMVNTCCELGFKTRALKGGPRHILNYYYGIIEVSNFK